MIQFIITYPFTDEDKTFLRQIIDGGKVYITAEDLGLKDDIVDMIEDGSSAKEIAKKYGICSTTVTRIRTANNLSKQPKLDSGKRYVYGLKGIQELFNVSHGTAQKYKDGILKDAVFQSGRKIVVDVDKAMELFKSNE